MVGTESSLRLVQTKLEEIYELKYQILGPQRHHEQEVKYLGRHICWTNGGVTIEADAKHVSQLLRDLGMLDCNSVNTPVTVSPKDDQGELLGVVQARLYRKSAARIAYLSQDRPGLSHASCVLATGMANPTTTDMWRLKRAARYLKGHARAKIKYEFQEPVQELTLYTDSDWATDLKTRRSLSGGLLFHGKHYCNIGPGSDLSLL